MVKTYLGFTDKMNTFPTPSTRNKAALLCGRSHTPLLVDLTTIRDRENNLHGRKEFVPDGFTLAILGCDVCLELLFDVG
jgi:hypothetical protein